MEQLKAHSPLGASGSYRWMACPGSVQLSEGTSDPESDFAAEGTAAHAVLEHCLNQRVPAWKTVRAYVSPSHGLCGGEEGLDYPQVTAEMANAVQQAIDSINLWHPDRDQGNSWVERRFHCPSIHPLFYGTSDFTYFDAEARTLHVWDYKHGAGIVVEVQRNPQIMYYACGVLEDLMIWDSVDLVVCHIMQPRGYHSHGPHRHWSVTTEDLRTWLDGELVPAMNRAQTDTATASGEHCRFCPVRRYACPQILADADELEEMLEMIESKKSGVADLTPKQVGRFLNLTEIIKIAGKAARETGYARASKGTEIPGWKLAKKRANRDWKKGAEGEAKKVFGKNAYQPQKLRSPAMMEELPKGDAFAQRWATKPDAGLQLVPDSNSRPEQSPATKSMFKPVKASGSKRKK